MFQVRTHENDDECNCMVFESLKDAKECAIPKKYEFVGIIKDKTRIDTIIKVSYAISNKVIISGDDENFPKNLNKSMYFVPRGMVGMFKDDESDLGQDPSVLNWFYNGKKEKRDDDFCLWSAFLDEESHCVLQVKEKIQKLKEAKKFKELVSYLKPFLKYGAIPKEDDLHIAMKAFGSSLDELRDTERYQKWAYFLTEKYKFIYVMFDFAKYCRYYGMHMAAYDTILNIRKLIMFDKEYRPKNNEEILIKDCLLDFEETILTSYVSSRQFGLECSIRYLLHKKINVDNIIHNLQFYVPLMDDYISDSVSETKEKEAEEKEKETREEKKKLARFPILIKNRPDALIDPEIDVHVENWRPFIVSDVATGKTYTMHESSLLFNYVKSLSDISAQCWTCLVLLDGKYFMFIEFDKYLQKIAAVSLPFQSKILPKENIRDLVFVAEENCYVVDSKYKIFKTVIKFLQV